MGIFDKLKKEQLPVMDDHQIVAVAKGKMIEPHKINDPMFAQEMMGQTIGFELEDNYVAAPANGKLEVMFPTGHAFAIRMNNGQGLLVHIGINTVELNGKGFKTMVRQGETVKAGQKLVELDVKGIRKAGYDITTMPIVTEPHTEGHRENYIPFGKVDYAQVINQA